MIDKVLKIVVALGYMLAIILALFLFMIALWTIGGWIW